MKFKKSQIDKICPKGDVRLQLNNLYLDVETSLLKVTNGHYAVQVPVQLDEGDVSGFVSVEAIKAARRKSIKVVNEGYIHILCKADSLHVVHGGIFDRPDHKDRGHFNFDRLSNKNSSSTRIAFNAKYLYEITKAFECTKSEFIILDIPDMPNSPIRITAMNSEDKEGKELGILMQMRV